MKSTRRFLTILFLLALPVASLAAKNSKEVTFDTAVKVGSTQLDAGTYRVTWNGSGPQVEVNFSQNGKTITSATAQLSNDPGPYDAAVQLGMDSDGSAILREIDFKNLELVFSSPDQPPTSGN